MCFYTFYTFYGFINHLSRPLVDHLDGSSCRRIINGANNGKHSADAEG